MIREGALQHFQAPALLPACLGSLTSPFLGVDAGECQVLPELLQQVVQVQLHATAAKHQGHLFTAVVI